MNNNTSLVPTVITYGLKPNQNNPWVSTTLADIGEETISKHLRNIPLMNTKVHRNSI